MTSPHLENCQSTDDQSGTKVGTSHSDLSASSISTQAVEQGAGNHDDGPWAVCTDPPNSHWYAAQTIFSVSQGTRVADLCTLSAAYEANGRLIAAAPDMLAALQELTDGLFAANPDWNSITTPEAVVNACAAISKATGASK